MTTRVVSYQKTLLATLVGFLISGSSFALEELNDHSLGEATGEGIALLPEDFSMVFMGDTATHSNLTARAKDTGYLRLIPVGPLATTTLDYNGDDTVNSTDNFVGKADIFLYGQALSAADGNLNNRYSNQAIASWGTPTNPWILKIATETQVPTFKTTETCAGANDTKCHVTYLAFEAPMLNKVIPNGSASTKDGSAAYNLKLGMWADAFVRNPFAAENLTATGTQFNSPAMYSTTVPATLNRANRLRLQMVWDGFGINGSRLQMFQTLGGVGATETTQGLSVFANNTLGLAGVLRFNSGDTTGLRANVTIGSESRTEGNWVQSGGGDASQQTQFNNETAQYRFNTRTVTDTQSNLTWSLPSGRAKALRLSTQESTSPQSKLSTPAINGGDAPTFNATEGLHFYNPNINLVLGSLYQPLIIGTDGKNFNLELVAIPNKPEIYKKIYTDYRTLAQGKDISYLGSTCNVHQCGTDVSIGGENYQGYNATHSSISIGSTEYDAANNRLSAYKGVEAFGVSFGALAGRTASGTHTQVRNEVQFLQRQKRDRSYILTDLYRLRDDSVVGGEQTDPYGGDSCGSWLGRETCNRSINIIGRHTDWVYLTSISPSGEYVYGDAGGAYTIYCNTAYSCLAGKPVGATVNANGNLVGSPTVGTVVNSHPGAGTSLNQFIAGLDNCWTGQLGADVCNGTNSTSTGIHGLSGINDGNFPNGRAPQTDNLSWSFDSRNTRWFATQANGQVLDGRAMAVHGNAHVIPTTISTINVSPLNNFGSAVIDGMLIQHMKITTKGL